MVNNLFRFFVVAAFFCLVSGCYTLNQAHHQYQLLSARENIEDALVDPKISPTTKGKLRDVQAILAFALKEGFPVKSTYRYFVDLNGPYVSYIVQATPPYRFEWVTYWFPIVGSVPYLGFFDKAERDAKAEVLKNQGYDVAVGGVDGFSSLGWFDDPIYSPMLDRSNAELAHLLFHEMTHRTLWIPSQPEFNEHLAEWVGQSLTIKYAKENLTVLALDQYLAGRWDMQIYHNWVKKVKNDLERLYSSEEAHGDKIALEQKKQAIFVRYTTIERPLFLTDNFQFAFSRKWNNAYLMSAQLYSPDYRKFDNAFHCSHTSNTMQFLDMLKERIKKWGDIELAMHSFCS